MKPPSPRGAWLVLGALLFLALWIVPPFHGLATMSAVNIQDDIYMSDLLNDRLPARAEVGRLVSGGELPLWTRGIYTGFPLLAAVEVGALYPTNLLLFSLMDPWSAIAWAQLLPLFLAGLGAFLLARELGLPVPAALLSAGSLSLSGFFVCHLRQLNMVDAACWIPWVFWSLERSFRAGGAAIPGTGLLWTLQILAGHPQISFFTALVALPWALARRRAHRGAGRPWADPVLLRLVVAVSLGTIIASAQLVPGYELARLSHREGGFTYEEAARYPASPRSLLSFVAPYANGDPGNDTFHLPGVFWEQYGYLGLLPLALAVVGAVVRRRHPAVIFLLATAALSGLLFLGPATPAHYLVHTFVPGMNLFRFPTRFLVFVELAVSILAAFGLTVVLERIRSRRAGWLVAVLVLGVTAGDLWFHQARQVPLVDRETWTSPVPTVERLRQTAPSRPWRYFSLDSTLVHVSMFHGAGGWNGDRDAFVRFRSMIQPGTNLLHGLEAPDGYVNLAPRAYESVWGSDKEPGMVRPSGAAGESGWELRPEVVRLLRAFNVHAIVSAVPVDSPALHPPEAFPEGYGIQWLRDPLPRAFVVGRVVPTEGPGEAAVRMGWGGFDPAREALVSGDVTLPPGSSASRNVRVTTETSRSLELVSDLTAPGLLVVSEAWYPGWKAWLDDEPVEIHRANVMMRSVVVPAGRHEVRFEFRPQSVRTGFWSSVAGLLGLLLAWRWLVRVRR